MVGIQVALLPCTLRVGPKGLPDELEVEGEGEELRLTHRFFGK